MDKTYNKTQQQKQNKIPGCKSGEKVKKMNQHLEEINNKIKYGGHMNSNKYATARTKSVQKSKSQSIHYVTKESLTNMDWI